MRLHALDSKFPLYQLTRFLSCIIFSIIPNADAILSYFRAVLNNWHRFCTIFLRTRHFRWWVRHVVQIRRIFWEIIPLCRNRFEWPWRSRPSAETPAESRHLLLRTLSRESIRRHQCTLSLRLRNLPVPVLPCGHGCCLLALPPCAELLALPIRFTVSSLPSLGESLSVWHGSSIGTSSIVLFCSRERSARDCWYDAPTSCRIPPIHVQFGLRLLQPFSVWTLTWFIVVSCPWLCFHYLAKSLGSVINGITMHVLHQFFSTTTEVVMYVW